ncbi:MAG: type IV secretory system conjugative DNA transfer family protein, partial [Caulobacteraceae bacterium]|nr:type IV secretory system conjugative DNA transfer family protein [Caulobacteraceae bacterium]
MSRRLLLAGAAAPAFLAAWDVASSNIFLYEAGLWDSYEWPESAWAWLQYVQYAGQDPLYTEWLSRASVGGFGATAVAAALLGNAWLSRGGRRGPPLSFRTGKGRQRGASSTFGDARWAERRDIRDRYPGPHPIYGGVAVGELYRPDQQRFGGQYYHPKRPWTWGEGGKAPLIVDDLTSGSGHTIRISGSGGGKTEFAKCSLHTFFNSAVVLDPKGKIGAATRHVRERMGHKVITIRPGQDGLNLFNSIDPLHPRADLHIRNLAANLCAEAASSEGDDGGKGSLFYRRLSIEVVAVLIGEILYNPACPDKSPRTLRAMQARSPDDLRDLLTDIAQNSPCRWVRQAAGACLGERGTRSEIWTNLHQTLNYKLGWLGNDSLAQMVSGGPVRASDILGGRTTVYVEVDFDTLQSTPQAPRAILGAFMREVMRNGREEEKVLCLIDE